MVPATMKLGSSLCNKIDQTGYNGAVASVQVKMKGLFSTSSSIATVDMHPSVYQVQIKREMELYRDRPRLSAGFEDAIGAIMSVCILGTMTSMGFPLKCTVQGT